MVKTDLHFKMIKHSVLVTLISKIIACAGALRSFSLSAFPSFSPLLRFMLLLKPISIVLAEAGEHENTNNFE